jgi:hypothetical protein
MVWPWHFTLMGIRWMYPFKSLLLALLSRSSSRFCAPLASSTLGSCIGTDAVDIDDVDVCIDINVDADADADAVDAVDVCVCFCV